MSNTVERTVERADGPDRAQTSAGSARFGTIDGIRAYAIILIVLSHCLILNQGGVGNSLFFVVSGFLAASPLKTDAEATYTKLRNWFVFYTDKIFRICPPMYVCLIIVFLGCKIMKTDHFGSVRSLILNMLLVEPWGHLWYLQSIMLMYAAVPPIMAIGYLIKKRFFKGNNNIGYCLSFAAAVGLAAIICRLFVMPNLVIYYKNFQIHQFLIGFSAAYIYKAVILYRRNKNAERPPFGMRLLYSVVSAVISVFFIVSANVIICRINFDWRWFFIGWDLPMTTALLSAALLLSLVLNERGIIGRIYSFPLFGFIGQMSFGIYLIHYFLLAVTGVADRYKTFAAVFVVSLGGALLLYLFTEKPFTRAWKRRSIKAFFSYFVELYNL